MKDSNGNPVDENEEEIEDLDLDTFKGPMNVDLISKSDLYKPIKKLEKLVQIGTNDAKDIPFVLKYVDLTQDFNSMVEDNPSEKEYHYEITPFKKFKNGIDNLIALVGTPSSPLLVILEEIKNELEELKNSEVPDKYIVDRFEDESESKSDSEETIEEPSEEPRE